jgi:hypothetical protein
MGLGKDHPDSEYILKVAARRMKIYLSVFGPEGEWNESVGYSNSVRDTVKFCSALRYWSTARGVGLEENVLGTHPLPHFCRWKMYMTLPHGREARMGNCTTIPKVCLPFVPAVAAASRDGVLQWFHVNNQFSPEETDHTRNYVLELLGYNPTLEPVHPEGRLPHGHAFRANTMCVSSRTDWNPVATPCVVYGKGGAAYEIHGHHDVGQVLDTTDVYEGVKQVRRTVVHLDPGVVVVLDRATLDEPRDISLRWHTADKCRPEPGGRFVVCGGQNACLESQLVNLGDGALTIARNEHEETRASYIEASLNAPHCSILSLFSVSKLGGTAQRWKGSNGLWSIQTPEGILDVRVSSAELLVAYRNRTEQTVHPVATSTPHRSARSRRPCSSGRKADFCDRKPRYCPKSWQENCYSKSSCPFSLQSVAGMRPTHFPMETRRPANHRRHVPAHNDD